MENKQMVVVRIPELELGEFGYLSDHTARVRGTFPFSVATGNASTAMVYFELAPGKRLATHTDSAEEILVILQGTAEVSVGEEQAHADAGAMVVVPAMVPHGVLNVGDEVARVIGFFASNTVMSTFAEPLLPTVEMPAPPEAERTLLTPAPGLLETAPAPA